MRGEQNKIDGFGTRPLEFIKRTVFAKLSRFILYHFPMINIIYKNFFFPIGSFTFTSLYFNYIIFGLLLCWLWF